METINKIYVEWIRELGNMAADLEMEYRRTGAARYREDADAIREHREEIRAEKAEAIRRERRRQFKRQTNA